MHHPIHRPKSIFISLLDSNGALSYVKDQSRYTEERPA